MDMARKKKQKRHSQPDKYDNMTAKLFMKCILSMAYQSEQVMEPANNNNLKALLQMRKERVLIRDI